MERSRMSDIDELSEDEQSEYSIIHKHPLNETNGKRSKIGTVRYTIAYMGFTGFFLVYAMRINISVALVDMVRHDIENDTMNDNCPVDEKNSTFHSGFDWSNQKQSDVLGAFYYGYIFMQLPSGILATKFGAKYIFGLGVLSTGFFTLITPPAAHLGVNWLIAIRVIEGVTEAVTYPSFNALLGSWAPKFERSFFSAFSMSGAQFGNVLSQPLVGYLCDLDLWDGWPLGFYVTGIATIIWFLFWVFLVYDTPRRHPRIAEEEVSYIESNITIVDKPPTIPWKEMLKCPALYGLVIAHVSCMWINFGIMSCLPQYLSNVLNFDIKSNGLISAAPWLFCWISVQIFSCLTDFVRRNTDIPTTVLRKTNQFIGTCLPGVFLVLAGYAGCNSTLAVVLLVIGMFFFGAHYSASNCNNLDLAPRYAGVIFGIMNTFGTIPGFVAPKVVALMTDSDVHSVQLWREVFFVFAGVGFVGGLSFVILGSGELQHWANGDLKVSYYDTSQNDDLTPFIKDSDLDNEHDVSSYSR